MCQTSCPVNEFSEWAGLLYFNPAVNLEVNARGIIINDCHFFILLNVRPGLFVKSLKGAKAPLMIGAALAAGVMLSAPSVSGVMPMKEGPGGGKNMNMTDMGPPAGVGMAPPQPRVMSSPKAYDMSGVKMSSRANIRMSMPDASSSSVDFMRQASQLANGGKVRVRTTDDRAALNPHRLASKIHERL